MHVCRLLWTTTWRWHHDFSSSVRARMLLQDYSSVTHKSFHCIISVVVCQGLLQYLTPLSNGLQSPSCDIVKATQQASNIAGLQTLWQYFLWPVDESVWFGWETGGGPLNALMSGQSDYAIEHLSCYTKGIMEAQPFSPIFGSSTNGIRRWSVQPFAEAKSTAPHAWETDYADWWTVAWCQTGI